MVSLTKKEPSANINLIADIDYHARPCHRKIRLKVQTLCISSHFELRNKVLLSQYSQARVEQPRLNGVMVLLSSSFSRPHSHTLEPHKRLALSRVISFSRHLTKGIG